jgi:hypothetical protein
MWRFAFYAASGLSAPHPFCPRSEGAERIEKGPPLFRRLRSHGVEKPAHWIGGLTATPSPPWSRRNGSHGPRNQDGSVPLEASFNFRDCAAAVQKSGFSGKGQPERTPTEDAFGPCLMKARHRRFNSATHYPFARRRRNAPVAARWHFRQSVRMLERSHSPPPSATGMIWSASQRWRRRPQSFSNCRRAR